MPPDTAPKLPDLREDVPDDKTSSGLDDLRETVPDDKHHPA
jgi:hypothetical protein